MTWSSLPARSRLRPVTGVPVHRRFRVLRLVTLVFALAAFPSCEAPPQEQGEPLCFAVLDGDSIQVLVAGQVEEIRLHGIDAPEGDQSFGSQAREHLASLVLHKPVELERRDIDRYGRTVARVRASGTDISEAMVGQGLAWHYVRYSDDQTLARLQQEAKVRSLGLWSDPAARPPWEFRQSARRPWSTQGILSTTATAPEGDTDGLSEYSGNRKSLVFHRRVCRYFDCSNCTKVFTSRKAALDAGYRPCGLCRP